MKFEAKNVMLGRKPRAKKTDDFKVAFFKLFITDHPLRGMQFPEKELEFPNIEYVKVLSNIEYYLEGNDIVFRNIKSINIEEKDHILYVTTEEA